jgi:hypothetical protein
LVSLCELPEIRPQVTALPGSICGHGRRFPGLCFCAWGDGPALTKENLNDLRLLCEEFGFTRLLTQVSDFQEWVSVVDDEAQRGDSDITEENFEIRWALSLLQEALSGL